MRLIDLISGGRIGFLNLRPTNKILSSQTPKPFKGFGSLDGKLYKTIKKNEMMNTDLCDVLLK